MIAQSHCLVCAKMIVNEIHVKFRCCVCVLPWLFGDHLEALHTEVAETNTYI